MTYIKLIIPLIIINIVSAQSPTVRVEGSHTLTQGNGIGIYEAVDLCLKQAIINGVFDYLNTKHNFEDDQRETLLKKLDPIIEMCVTEPSIMNQLIDGNTISIQAQGQVDPMILNSILGLE